jgi:murein DD-endopeptidase MepM/ murein hydrolase activator NlpD
MNVISASVGNGGRNSRNDVTIVQALLNRHRRPPLALLSLDGIAGGQTNAAIEHFQKHNAGIMIPDGRVDVGGRTWSRLSTDPLNQAPCPELKNIIRVAEHPKKSFSGCTFPLPLPYPELDWTSGMRRFGADREKVNGKATRAHAACDLYAPADTPIFAVAEGFVLYADPTFYAGSGELAIDHGAFIARYCEVEPNSFLVKRGDTVKAGQPIAKIGKLNGINLTMLHFEMYDKTAEGNLTQKSIKKSKLRSDLIPFSRRKDLIDPTTSLLAWTSARKS